jgi:hypothetical protein
MFKSKFFERKEERKRTLVFFTLIFDVCSMLSSHVCVSMGVGTAHMSTINSFQALSLQKNLLSLEKSLLN